MKHLQIFGTYLEDLEHSLRIRGVEIESVIRKVNPVTIMFPPDESKQKHCNELRDRDICLDIRKNLKNMLSRDTQSFESNVLLHDCGEPVRSQNGTEYILVYNSYLNAKLLLDNEVLYTYKKQSNGVFEEMLQNGAVLKEFTYLKSIDWKKYFDQFIEIIKEQYDANHIILLKMCAGPWYVNEFGISEFQADYQEYMRLANEMDSYFEEKTNCICLNDFLASVSDRNPNCLAPFALRSKDEMERVADEVCKIMDDAVVSHNIGKHIFFDYDVRKKEKEAFAHYSQCGIDNVNDLIFIYKLYQFYGDAWDFTDIVKNIIGDRESAVAKRGWTLFAKNKRYLEQYPYLSRGVTFEIGKQKEAYFKLEHGYYIKVSLNEKPLVEILQYEKKFCDDFETILQNDMCCPLSQVRAVSGNLSFYIARARAGYGNSPMKIKFYTEKELLKTMFLLDWEEILESERFHLEIQGKEEIKEEVEKYQARTDLGFLFAGKARIFILRAGLADQIKYYLLSKVVTNDEEYNVWYDDTAYYRQRSMNGFELQKVIYEELKDRLLSNVFSPMLLKKNFGSGSCGRHAADLLFENGLTELLFVTDCPSYLNLVQKVDNIAIEGTDKFEKMRCLKNSIQYFYLYPRISDRGNYKKYINFPSFNTRENTSLAAEMLSCDAVALHIRRGDFITLGRNLDAHFFYESLEKLNAISDYKDKHIFVFSDDIIWCKENDDVLGFNLFPKEKVHYVEHNKGQNAFWDMKLISLGKVIIATPSGFSQVAALISEQREVYMCCRAKYVEVIESVTYKNKYDVGEYSKDYDYIE